jgi:hypothetical protein
MTDFIKGDKMAKTKPKTKNKCFYTKGITNISSHTLPEISHTKKGIPNRATAADVNLRSGNNRYDYYEQRTADKLPEGHIDIIASCQATYRKIGMVRNIIDLMTDFAAEGLELQHTTKSQERFYRAWATKVNLQGRAHDFMKLLMRDANVIVRRKNAIITKPVMKEMTKGKIGIINIIDETGVADPPEKVKISKKKIVPNEIPWKYTFLSPTMVEKIGGEVGRFFGSDSLGMRIPASLANSINNPKNTVEKKYVNELPPEVVAAAKKTNGIVKLNMDKIYIDYYKKDDWEDWGTPFLYGVLEDIMFKEKMRLADMAALDGVINVIRLWKLGKSDQQILPAPAIVDRLIGILQDNTGGGVMDLVWDDMIDLQIEYPPTDKILGPDKYISVNSDIVRGLGIPDSLIGGSDLGTRNAQSAFVQLKTLVERLEYVRSRAIRWMEGELRLVANAMGFKRTPAISFGIMSLRDEAAEKQLMIQLLDRNIISSEKTTEVFGVNYMIELERMKSEQEIRDNDGILEKSNPYNRPFSILEKQNDLDIKLEMVKQQRGTGGDSTDDNGGGDNPSGDQPKKDGVNPSGRPPSTKDTKPRDERTPTTQSILHIVADDLLDQIDKLVDNTYLEQHKVKNMRSLTKAQRTELEKVKRGLLSVLRPGDIPTKELILKRLDIIKDGAPSIIHIMSRRMETCFCDCVEDFTTSTKRTPTAKERRMLTCLAWANIDI